MMGLHRLEVALASPSSDWVRSFQQQKDSIQSVANGIIQEIHHVGSTAVPELSAKPIVDIAAVVDSFKQVPTLAQLLQPLGWIDTGFNHPEDYLFVLESTPEVRTHHLHVVEIGGAQLKEYIAFKEALLHDLAIRQDYEVLKRDLSKRFSHDRKGYTRAKGEFIRSILVKYGQGGVNK